MWTKTVPGTVLPMEGENTVPLQLSPLIAVTGGMSLGQVCRLSGLDTATVQNWVKRGFVARPINKKYYEKQVARILLINALRQSMRLEQVGELMRLINGDTEDESDDIVSEARLYEAFCQVMREVHEYDLTSVPRAVKNVPEARENGRLAEALTVMAYAFVAGKIKQEADTLLIKLKEKEK